jgi:hypothetical protein
MNGRGHCPQWPWPPPRAVEGNRPYLIEASEVLDALRSFKKSRESKFFLERTLRIPWRLRSVSAPDKWCYDYFRSDCTGRDLNVWLRLNSKEVPIPLGYTTCVDAPLVTLTAFNFFTKQIVLPKPTVQERRGDLLPVQAC